MRGAVGGDRRGGSGPGGVVGRVRGTGPSVAEGEAERVVGGGGVGAVGRVAQESDDLSSGVAVTDKDGCVLSCAMVRG